MELIIRTALPGDHGAIRDVLRQAALTEAGLDGPALWFVVAERAGQVVGCAGLEAYGRWGLLRSVAVAPEHRGGGLGRLLVGRVLGEAGSRGMEGVYLLTDSADDWFPRFGFSPAHRADVPREVRQSVEFQGACDESARVMFLSLSRPESTAP